MQSVPPMVACQKSNRIRGKVKKESAKRNVSYKKGADMRVAHLLLWS